MQNKITISNILLLFSVVATFFITIQSKELQNFYYLNWGTNSYFLEQGNYAQFFLQFFTGTFLHGGILHLAMNSIFIYYFGNIVELMLGKNKYLTFIIGCIIFNGVLLAYFVPYQNTVGISGVALALLTYYTLELWSQKNPEYTGGITAIIINIGIGFTPGISLHGHLFGVIFGTIFFFIIKNFFSKQEIGFINNYKKYLKKIPKAMPENFKKH